MEKAKIDYYSIENQKIREEFVQREVKACFSYEMASILSASSEIKHTKDGAELPSYEDIENLYEYKCPQCGEVIREGEDNLYTCVGYKCDYVAPLNDLMDSEPQDILEWWIVSEFMATHLSKRGEPVLEWGNNWYWGRTCSGQAISMDSVISDICEEMEILDGQKFSWAKTK